MADVTDVDRRVWWAKRIAALVGVLVALVFAVVFYLGYVYFAGGRPAKETLFQSDSNVP